MFLFLSELFAQSYNFVHFTIEDGLAGSQVFSITQDSNGYLLAATAGGGLNMFDGKEFKIISARDGLAGSSLNTLKIDSKDRIWVGTSNGISVLSSEGIKNYHIEDGLAGEEVWNIYESSVGDIWIGTTMGLSLFSDEGEKSFITYPEIDNYQVFAICEDNFGNLVIGTRKGLFVYNFKEFHHFTTKDGLLDNKVNSLLKSSDGSILIGTEHGVNKFENSKISSSFSKTNGLVDNSVLTIFEDSKNNIWFGTKNGLSKYSNGSFANFTEENGLADNKIWYVYEDNQGSIWVGTDKGLSCFRHQSTVIYNKNPIFKDVWAINSDLSGEIILGFEKHGLKKFANGKLQNYFSVNSFSDISVWTILKDSKNNLWLGTSSGALRINKDGITKFDKSNGFVDDEINTIYEDKEGNIWFGCYWEGVCKYDGNTFRLFTVKDGLKYLTVWSILEDSQGNYWFGTDIGISFYDGKTFKNDIGKEYLDGYGITGIVEDSHKNIWFGTNGNGLIKFSLNELNPGKSFDQISEKDALGNDFILFTRINGDNLFVGTNKGINEIDLMAYHSSGQKKVLSYHKNDGILRNECTQNAAYFDEHNNLWFGTSNGLVKNGLNFEKKETEKTNVIITDVHLQFNGYDSTIIGNTFFSDPVGDKDLVFEHDQNYLTFKFAGINLVSGPKVFYRYRLNGIDKDWSPPTKDRTITYPNLPSGEYTFVVTASTENGVWNNSEASFNFIIRTPFWQTPWFLTLLSVLIASAVLFLFRQKVKKINNRNDELEANIAERKRYEQKIEQSEKALNTIVKLLPVGVLVVDENKKIKRVNRTALSILSLADEKDIVGQESTKFYITDKKGKSTREMASSGISILEGKTIVRNGKRKYILASIVPIVLNNENLILEVIIDNTAHKQAEQALSENEKRFREFVANATVGIYRTTISGKILMENEALTKMLGYDPVTEKKSNASGVYRVAKTRDKFIKILQKHGEVKGFEAEWVKKNGEIITTRESARAIKNKKGEIVFIEGIVEDVTEMKRAETALIHAKELAEKSDNFKSEFLAQMSHEIRTPVNSILSYTSFLKDEVWDLVPEDYRFSFDMINNGGRRLIRTIDALLNMSSLQTGTFETRPTNLNITEDILYPLITEFQIQAESKELELSLRSDVDKDIVVFGDAYTTTQLFANLVDNALKYTNRGSVEIAISSEKNNQLSVKVIDTGIGIAKEYLPKLFAPFTQEEQGYTRKFEGNGLGLALVAKYCDLNKYKIEVESTKGQGTTFTVNIKL